ncbi:MAG: hypothetical protein RBG13Loki_3209 [Promethearchaeota archaeon CR_4]|nr:MAG: hypothetical protein RBG13Loki_3209 [Candidatus Lokiarchaeota archaeon CR_4]
MAGKKSKKDHAKQEPEDGNESPPAYTPSLMIGPSPLYCPHCRKSLPPVSPFCPYCGQNTV